MFCFQCEQTFQGTGCVDKGICGKDSDVAALQDYFLHALKELSFYALEGRKVGINEDEINRFIVEGIFSTLTNVNFDPDRFVQLINQTQSLQNSLKEKIQSKGAAVQLPGHAGADTAPTTLEGLVAEAEKVGIKADPNKNEDILSLQELLVYGIKGLAAYTDHALILGQQDDEIFKFIQEAMVASSNDQLSADDLVGLVMKCGEVNLKAMELLDAGHTGTYGHPIPTSVPLGAKKGKAILVSGHDLKDLEILLKQTEGKGINIYTHGEMLPAHGYPELKKYSHLYGHYGTAWQNQAKEFDQFPGAILMTTNCIQKPKDTYKSNIFTTSLVGWPGVSHIQEKDFTPLIEKTLELPGYSEDQEGQSVLTGFARNAVLGVADKVIEAVKAKAIRHFFLVGGCDGAKPGRNYYTEFVEKAPQDTVILTLACGKFRFFDKDLGNIGGIPRLLDVGQCNDAYSAIQIAVALAKAFECGVNDLPLSMVLSWYEQKACVILLSLLYLGIKDIRLGPSLPAFVSPNILNVLVEKFNIMPIKTAEEDLATILGRKP